MKEIFKEKDAEYDKKYEDDKTIKEYLESGKTNIGDLRRKVEERIEVLTGKKKREIEVCAYLNKVGLEYNEKMEICKKYIEEGIGEVKEINEKCLSIDDIIRITEEIEFYRTRTNYIEELNKTIKKSKIKDERMREKLLKYKALKKYIIDKNDMIYIPESLNKDVNLIVQSIKY